MREKTEQKLTYFVNDIMTFGWIPGNVAEVAKKYNMDQRLIKALRLLNLVDHSRKENRVFWTNNPQWTGVPIDVVLYQAKLKYNEITVDRAQRPQNKPERVSWLHKLIKLIKK